MRQETHLRDLVRALGWSYSSLWSPSSSSTTALEWADGCFEANPLKRYDPSYWNVEELFNSSNKTCNFARDSGYAAKVLIQSKPLWLTGTDTLVRNSHTTTQAQFFKVAGIQTLLCIPWLNSVVEIGSTGLVYENQNLLLQIRAFLSHMPAAKQHQEANALSPVQGTLVSPRSDEASDGMHQVESLGKWLDMPQQNLQSAAEDSIQDELLRHWEADQEERSEVCRRSAALGQDLNRMVVGSGDGEWEFQGLATSPTSTLQFTLSNAQEQQPMHMNADSSLLLSPRQQMPLLSQLHYNQAKSSSENSQSSSDCDGKTSSLRFRGSVSSKSGSLAFKPWKSRKGSESPEMRQSNQSVLRQSINMTHKLSRLNSSENKADDHKTVGLARHSVLETRDVLSSHDEAAVNHMLAERKRRQKQKENFAALRALIPFVSKMDRASILGDAINYLKQLTSRVEELESLNRELQSQLPPQYVHKSSSRSSTISL